MQRRGLSYRDLEALTGRNAGYLCRVAHGSRRPSPETAFAIGRALGVSPLRLLKETR